MCRLCDLHKVSMAGLTETEQDKKAEVGFDAAAQRWNNSNDIHEAIKGFFYDLTTEQLIPGRAWAAATIQKVGTMRSAMEDVAILQDTLLNYPDLTGATPAEKMASLLASDATAMARHVKAIIKLAGPATSGQSVSHVLSVLIPPLEQHALMELAGALGIEVAHIPLSTRN